MHIELMVVDGCPHADRAHALLRQALYGSALADIPIEITVIASDQDARRRGFTGSPSFFANGRDLLPEPAMTPALACRLYRSTAGLSPLPDPHDLQRALETAAGTAAGTQAPGPV